MGRFRAFDDTELSFDADGSGPVVVLLHGYAMDVFSNWARPGLTERLTRAGYRTVALDQRGHGMSGKPHDPAAYGGDAMVRDVRSLLDDIGVERVALVGYSMGAMNTVRLLIDGDPRVKAAVLGGIGAASIVLRGGGEVIADAMEAEDKSTITQPFAKSFRDFADTVRADRKALAALQRREVEPFGDVSTIVVPTLVLAAEGDPLIGDPRALAEQIPGAEVAVVGGSHLNVVNNPQFHDAVIAFLDTHRDAFA